MKQEGGVSNINSKLIKVDINQLGAFAKTVC